MREIIFDIETTGLDYKQERIIEIGAVELINRFQSGKTFHEYINPEGKEIHPEALAIHGINAEFLKEKPTFSEIIEKFLSFIEGAKLIAHNASFDVSFLNEELKRFGHKPIESERIIDTLALARRKHPMGPNTLDALCRRYKIDNTQRVKHGALLDSQLLAEIYVELIGGKQSSMILENNVEFDENKKKEKISVRKRPSALPARITQEEQKAHDLLVSFLGKDAIWFKIQEKRERKFET